MSREIRFRAWDKEEKRMLDWHEHSEEIKEAIPRDCGDEWTERCEVMQFTGLLDKNGQEIYEGDIVRSNSLKPFTVEWSDGTWYGTGWILRRVDNRCVWGLDHKVPCRVLGNIHENGDLIQ